MKRVNRLNMVISTIDEQKALRLDCIYNIEIVLEIRVSDVCLHSTNNVLTLTHVPAWPANATRLTSSF